jgi:protein-tyrosine phosphatase
MNNSIYTRQVSFESIENFRDLGGYYTREGYKVAWRKLFRSGDLSNMTGNDLTRLRNELELTSVINLRSNFEIEQKGLGLLTSSGIKYHHVSLISDGGDREANERRYKGLTNMGEFYLQLIRQKEFGQRIIEALEIIAEPANHPLVFHCSAGKDRTGILAAIVLSILEVADEDIVNDYCLSAPYIEMLFNRFKSEPQMDEGAESLPEYFWKVVPENMDLFLNTLKQEYGTVQQYIHEQGSEPSIVRLLKMSLLRSQ